MSDYRHRRSQVSRTLDESELMVDDRIDNFVRSSVPVDLYKASAVSMSYDWLKEDLAMRSAIGADLQKQQMLTYAASERRALADQVERQNRDDDETVKVLGEVNELVQKGMPAAQARQEILRRDPGRLMNKRLLGALDDFGRSEFDEEQYKLDRARLTMEGLQTAMKNEDLGALKKLRDENPNAYEDAVKHLEAARLGEAEKGARESELGRSLWASEKQIREMESAQRLHDARKNAAIQLNDTVDPNDFDKIAAISGTLDSFGIDVVDVPKMANHWSKSDAVMTMLADEEWLGSESGLTIEDRERLSAALSNPGTQGEDAVVLRLAGRHQRQRAKELEYVKKYESKLKAVEEDAKRMEGFTKSIAELNKIPDVQAAAVAAVRPYTSLPGITPLADKVSAAVQELGTADLSQAKSKLSSALAEFFAGVRQLGVSPEQSSAKPTVKPITPEQANRIREVQATQGRAAAEKLLREIQGAE